ncbi:MAG: arsenic resistance N-acetyltransferase ArsN2 [Kofleriaceae bacterium]
MTLTIQSVDHAATAVRLLLTASDLPADDIDDPAIALFGAFDGESLAGVVGLQQCGDIGLLRSLAVAPPYRDRGVARMLCEHVFENAHAMSSLWLITTTAKDYFTRHAFEVVPREDVPEPVRRTAQFASLCPSSAHVMRRR